MEEEEVRSIQIGSHTFTLTKNPNGTYKSEPLPQPTNAEISLMPPQGKGRILAICESESNPGDKHYIILSPGGTIYCTCWGFRSPNKCWHYRWMMDTLKEIPLGKIIEPIKIGFTKKEG